MGSAHSDFFLFLPAISLQRFFPKKLFHFCFRANELRRIKKLEARKRWRYCVAYGIISILFPWYTKLFHPLLQKRVTRFEANIMVIYFMQ